MKPETPRENSRGVFWFDSTLPLRRVLTPTGGNFRRNGGNVEISQDQKFAPNGDYVRHFVLQLKDVDRKFIYEPWTMKTSPEGYPSPIIDIHEGRDRFLETAKSFLKG